jgi:hypothetical protein
MKRILLTLVTLIAGCGNRGSSLPAEAWGTADYVAAGVPDPGHAWTDVEVVTASHAIQRESADHRERLPRYRGAKSGAVFARLVEAPAPDDPAIAIVERFKGHMERGEALNALSKLYGFGRNPVPSRDEIELFGAMLREMATEMALIDPFLASLGPDGRTPARLGGLEQARRGAGGMVTGALMIVDGAGLALDDKRALVQHLTPALPSLFAQLLPDTQHDVRGRLAALVDATDGPLHDDLVAAQRALPPP